MVMKKPLLAAISLLLASSMAQAAQHTAPMMEKSPAMEKAPSTMEKVPPDNTKVNKRDRDDKTLTPPDQSNTYSDRSITKALRKAVVKADLSMNAKNIKIITRQGVVTLRGPVASKEEIDKIAELAKATPGLKSLNNKLEVK